jgi:hypothetical protein
MRSSPRLFALMSLLLREAREGVKLTEDDRDERGGLTDEEMGGNGVGSFSGGPIRP